jgi:hypothetical protein
VARFVNYVSDIVVFTSIDGLDYEFGYVLAVAEEGLCFRPACNGCATAPEIIS